MTPEQLKEALEQSVKLQSHYAELLNMHDGGQRLTFANAQAWLDRLDQAKREENSDVFPGFRGNNDYA